MDEECGYWAEEWPLVEAHASPSSIFSVLSVSKYKKDPTFFPDPEWQELKMR